MDKTIQELTTIKYGEVDLELSRGDIFSLEAEGLVCPVDSDFKTDQGLFKEVKKRFALPLDSINGKKKLFLGNCHILDTNAEGSSFQKIIFVSVFTMYGTTDRDLADKGLQKALALADQGGLSSLATPLLGLAKANTNYQIMCWVILRAMRAFGAQGAKNLKKVYLSVFNEKAYQECLEQFIAYR